MHELTPVVLFSLGALAVVGGIIYLAWVAAQKRRAALVEVALRMGFTFEAKVPKEQLGPFGPFHLFQRGYRRIARNLMTGKADDAPAMMLDYQYTIGGGKSSHTYHQTVALFPGAGTGLPEFTLAPERIWQKLGGLLGYQDIDFEASEEFSKHYLLRGPDETAIRAVFGAEALGFFAQSPGWSVESCGGSLAVYRSARRCKPDEFPPFLAESSSVRRALVSG